MFGAEMIAYRGDIESTIDKALKVVLDYLKPHFEEQPRLSSVAADTLLRQSYLLWGGFITYEQLEANPAIIMQQFDAEDAYMGTLWEDHAHQYVDLAIGDTFNISWLDYMALPKHALLMLRKEAEKVRERKNNHDAKLLAEAQAKGLLPKG